MKKKADGIRSYSERLQPQIRLLYRAAHVITGNRRMAECVLSNAILRAYLNRSDWRERMSFREGVLHYIRAEAREQMRRDSDADRDWTGISAPSSEKHPLLGPLMNEHMETQRIMALRYGCSVSVREIGTLTGRTPEQVRTHIACCQARIERAAVDREQPRKSFDRQMMRDIRWWMNRESSEPIDVGYFLSTFEKDAAGAKQPRRVVMQVIKTLLMVVGALALAVLVWMLAILMEP